MMGSETCEIEEQRRRYTNGDEHPGNEDGDIERGWHGRRRRRRRRRELIGRRR